VKKFCEEAMSSLKKESLNIERDSISEALGKNDIAKNQLDSKTSIEEALTTIQQSKKIDLIHINKWIVNPSLWIQAIDLKANTMQDNFPHIENKLYTFEANDTIEPYRIVVQLIGKCVQCVEQGKASTSGNK